MDAVTFAAKAKTKGKGSALSTVVDAVASAVTGQPMNGTVGGKKGFQPGNNYGARRHTKGRVDAARKGHAAAHKALSSHTKKGTVLSPEGRAALRASKSAARELQSARAAHQVATNADRATAAREKRAAAKVAAPAMPAPVAARVKTSAAKNAGSVTDRAHAQLESLKKGARDGTHDADAILAHVDRIARGAKKDELFEAAKRAGIEHGAKTKKDLVDHLKTHLDDHRQAGEAARKPAPTLKEKVAAEGTHVPTGREPAAGAGGKGVPEGPAGDRKIKAAIVEAIRRPGDHGLPHLGGRKSDQTLVHIAHIRDFVRAKLGPVDRDRFDRIAKRMHFEEKGINLLESGDTRDFTQHMLDGTLWVNDLNGFQWFVRTHRRPRK